MQSFRYALVCSGLAPIVGASYLRESALPYREYGAGFPFRGCGLCTGSSSLLFFSGLGGMVGWGVADFFAKKTIDKLGDVTTLFWAQAIGIVPLLVLFLWLPEMPQMSRSETVYLVILGVWSGLSYIPTYVAFGKGKVSLLSPLFATYAVVVAVLSALLLHEAIPFSRQIAFAIVFGGVLLITGDVRHIYELISSGRRIKRDYVAGVPEIALAICLYSLWLIALDRFLHGRYWVPFLLIIRIASAASLFVYAKWSGRKLAVVDRSLWKYLILVGCFDVAAFAFVSYGFSTTPYVSVVTMLSAAFSLPTIVLARTFLGERTTR